MIATFHARHAIDLVTGTFIDASIPDFPLIPIEVDKYYSHQIPKIDDPALILRRYETVSSKILVLANHKGELKLACDHRLVSYNSLTPVQLPFPVFLAPDADPLDAFLERLNSRIENRLITPLELSAVESRGPISRQNLIFDRGSLAGLTLDISAVINCVAQECGFEITTGHFLIYCHAAYEQTPARIETDAFNWVVRGSYQKLWEPKVRAVAEKRLAELAPAILHRNAPRGVTFVYNHPSSVPDILKAIRRSSFTAHPTRFLTVHEPPANAHESTDFGAVVADIAQATSSLESVSIGS